MRLGMQHPIGKPHQTPAPTAISTANGESLGLSSFLQRPMTTEVSAMLPSIDNQCAQMMM
jgi:hypothetical protein